MKANLSTDKASLEPQSAPVINVSTMETNTAARSSRLTKKHALIAVVSLLAVGLVVACVLAAIRIFTDSQIEVVKYSMTFKDDNNNKVNQTVSVVDNSVIYRVVRDGVEAWVINDFDKNVQVIKAKTNQGVVCYATPLNRSMAQDPNSVPSSPPSTNQTTSTKTVTYTVLPDELSDITFLGSKVADACNNIPTHWQVPSCNEAGSRVKRQDIIIIRLTIFYKDGTELRVTIVIF